MDQFRDPNSVTPSPIDRDDSFQVPQESEAFGDFEKPFPITIGVTPVAWTEDDETGRVGPGQADPTVYNVQTFRIPEGETKAQYVTFLDINKVRSQIERMVNSSRHSKSHDWYWNLLNTFNGLEGYRKPWCDSAAMVRRSIIAYCGMSVFLEFGTTLPRSGGEKVYLERIYRKPKYLAICVYAVQFVLLANTVGNTISCAQYFLRAISPSKYSGSSLGVSPSEGASKGVAIGAMTIICLTHLLHPKFGVIIGGIAASTGVGNNNPERSNFSRAWERGPEDDTPRSWAMALLAVIFSYRGWENANYVLGEVRNAPKTLRRSAPLAVVSIAILYILVNVSYFAALPRERIENGGVTIAAEFFLDVFGNNVFVTIIIPLLISISAFGNILAVTFANSRVKQELGKSGALPWSSIWASNKPFNTPGAALFLHWVFSVILIAGPNSADVYNFVVLLFTYSQTIVGFFIGIGLIYLKYFPSQRLIWQEETKGSYHCWWPFTAMYLLSNLFLIVSPFVPNRNNNSRSMLTGSIPYWCFPATGCSVVIPGVIYWVGFAKIWSIFGMAVEVEKDEDILGNEVVRYKHVRRTRETRTEGSAHATSALSLTHERQQNNGEGPPFRPDVNQEPETRHRG